MRSLQFFAEPMRINSALSGLSFNLFVNMKFSMSFRQFFSFCIERNLLATVLCITGCHQRKSGSFS